MQGFITLATLIIPLTFMSCVDDAIDKDFLEFKKMKKEATQYLNEAFELKLKKISQDMYAIEAILERVEHRVQDDLSAIKEIYECKKLLHKVRKDVLEIPNSVVVKKE